MTPLLFDINQVAAALGVGRRLAYELRKRADFPKAVVLSRKAVRYRASDVATFVERLTDEAAARPEPAQLRAAKAARRGPNGGASGGTPTPEPAKPRRSRALAERGSVEREKAPA